MKKAGGKGVKTVSQCACLCSFTLLCFVLLTCKLALEYYQISRVCGEVNNIRMNSLLHKISDFPR